MKQIKTLLIAGLLLALSSNAHALDLSRVKTWAASEILTAADLNGEFNNILNHSLTNNDIDAAAGIVGSKLNLSSPGIIGATTPAAATYTTLTINSTSIFKDKMSFTQTDNNEYIDSLTDGYLDFEATTGLRWRINTTEQMNLIDGSLLPTTDNDIDLGSTTKEFKDLWITGTANIDSLVADTADINAGTMDGVQIGGTTATGELIVNDASDDADGLGSQGTSGQFLQSAGAGVNPTWVTLPRIPYFVPDSTVVLAFDNGESAFDLSLHKNVITLTNLDYTKFASGKVSNICYDFDGTTDYAVVTLNSLWNNMAKFTLELWFYKDVTGLMHILDDDAGTDLFISVSDTNIRTQVDLTGGALDLNSAHGLVSNGTGAWVYLVITFDGTTLRYYVNGVVNGTTATSSGSTQNIGALTIGALAGGTEAWNGKIDGFRLLRNQVLSAADILARYTYYNSL